MTLPPGVTIRRVRAEEWERARTLRYEAVRDPDAAIAFLDTVETLDERPDDFWRHRTARVASSDEAAEFIAAVVDEWIGTLSVLVQPAGATDYLGRPVLTARADVVGVYVRPGHRGAGTVDALLAEAVDWACTQGVGTVSLDVHVDNERAQRAYRRAGFVETGRTTDGPTGTELEMSLSCRSRSGRGG